MRHLLDSGSHCAESARPPATDTTAGMVSVIKSGFCDPYSVQQKVKIVRTDLQPFFAEKKTHLLISDCLRLCLADTLTGEDINVKELPIIKILENKGAHRRPKAAERLIGHE